MGFANNIDSMDTCKPTRVLQKLLLQVSPGIYCPRELHHCRHSVHQSCPGVCGPPNEGCKPRQCHHELPDGMRQVSLNAFCLYAQA